MIIDFTVKNFGPIKDEQTISFEASKSEKLEDYYVINPKLKNGDNSALRLLKLGVIYGANASGKSTILEAFEFVRDLVCHPVEHRDDLLPCKPFQFNLQTVNEPSEFELRFVHEGLLFIHKIVATQKAVLEESIWFYNLNTTNRVTELFTRKTDLKNGVTLRPKFGFSVAKNNNITEKDCEYLASRTLWNNSILAGFNKANFKCWELGVALDWYRSITMPAITPKTDLRRFIIDLIEKNDLNRAQLLYFIKEADFNISDFEIIEKELNKIQIDIIKKLKEDEAPKGVIEAFSARDKTINFRHSIGENHYYLKYDDESLGTKRYYQLAGIITLLASNQRFLAIDEFESSLHPELIKHFFLEYLKNVKESQLLLTTHYRELMQDTELYRRDVVWFTEKNELAETQIYSLDDFSTTELRKENSIYNFYKQGKLGAVPNI